MTVLSNLVQRRDQALRDLVEIEQQLEAGEIDPAAAAELRKRYEIEAAGAIAALAARSRRAETTDATGSTTMVIAPRTRRLTGRRILYAAGASAAVAAVVMVSTNVLSRPPGGFVTGNEVLQQGGGASSQSTATPRDLASVTEAEMEKVVEANPKVIDMRLALAGRYAAKGRNDLAAVHYSEVLAQDPDNPEAQAHLGWMMLQLDRPQEAARWVDRALRSEPSMLDALWFQANIRLYGLDDAAGALATIDKMRALRDITPVVRGQVEELRSAALNAVRTER